MKIIIIGAGLSGLSAANVLSKNKNYEILMVEKENHIGGMADSFKYDDLLFDTGPHRFHTNNKLIKNFVLKGFTNNEIIELIKETKIYFNKGFLNYPLKMRDILFNLPPLDSLESFFSYIYYKMKKHLLNKKIENFDDFIKYNFGEKLNQIYFRPYTEKVWQTTAKNLSMEWARARIPLSSFNDLIVKTLFSSTKKYFSDKHPHSPYLSNFYYPKKGIFEISKRLFPANCELITNFNVRNIIKNKNTIIGISNGNTTINGDFFIFTNPITEISKMILNYNPQKLNYLRDFLYFVPIEKERISNNHWIYFSEKKIIFHRITEMKNFTPNYPKGRTGLILEIGNPLMAEKETFNIAIKQLMVLGLLKKNEVKNNNFTTRVLNTAYPIYKIGYKNELNNVFLKLKKFKNISLAGRQTLFSYMNMDQAILSGLNTRKEVKKYYEGN